MLRFRLRGPFVLYLSLFATSFAAELVNRTIDDQFPAGAADAHLVYSPGWAAKDAHGNCGFRLDEIFNGTWHEVSAEAGNVEPHTIVARFRGSAVYVYNIVAPNVYRPEDPHRPVSFLNFELDGTSVGASFNADAAAETKYHVPVYVNENLVDALHTLVIAVPPYQAWNLVLFDYIEYTASIEPPILPLGNSSGPGLSPGSASDPLNASTCVSHTSSQTTDSSSSLAPSPSPSTTALSNTASAPPTSVPESTASPPPGTERQPTNSRVGVLVGAIVGGTSSMFLLALGAFLLVRKRRARTAVAETQSEKEAAESRDLGHVSASFLMDGRSSRFASLNILIPRDEFLRNSATSSVTGGRPLVHAAEPVTGDPWPPSPLPALVPNRVGAVRISRGASSTGGDAELP